MKKITKIAGEVGCKLRDRTRSVKHRIMEIGRAARAKGSQGKEKLNKAYANLLSSTSRVVGQAKRFARAILDGTKHATSASGQAALQALKAELEQMVPRVRQVIAQTKARIFHGRRVPRARFIVCSNRQPRSFVRARPASPTNLVRWSSCRKQKTRA
jgi:IS5 family transposase